jgi:broad specificity phosphatase PhoE
MLNLLEPSFSTNPHNVLSDRVVIAMVGLPARGKSYISKAVVRYLNFLGCPTRLFNAGQKRRTEGVGGVEASFFDAKNLDAAAQRERMAMETLDELLEWLHESTLPDAGCACGIFDATNTTKARREKVRRRVAQERPPVRLVFVESICNDQATLDNNYRMKLSNDDYRGKDPEAALDDFIERVRQYEMVYEPVDDEYECRSYAADTYGSRRASVFLRAPAEAEAEAEAGAGAEEEEAGAAAAAAIAASAAESYEASPSSERRYSSSGRRSSSGSSQLSERPPPPGCLKLIDAGRKLVITGCEGVVMNTLTSLLSSIHLGPRCIWITLVGETANDVKGILGGDSALSRQGVAYAKAVREHILDRERSADLSGEQNAPAMLLTGTLRRYKQTAEILCEPGGGAGAASEAGDASDGSAGSGRGGEYGDERRRMLQLHRLNELCAGKLDSLTYDQMREDYPREYAARAADKLNYRYPGPGGESYQDVIMRLDSTILMLEQTRGNVLVVCDRAVCRVLLAYFKSAQQGGGAPDLESLPDMHVPAGVIELRRTHSGFTCTHSPIERGATTRVAGPGTAQARGQIANRLSMSLDSSTLAVAAEEVVAAAAESALEAQQGVELIPSSSSAPELEQGMERTTF